MATVNRPTNPAQKEKDINQKLQLFGVYSAFANGKVPSNKQIDVALNSALASKALSSPSSKLSAEGKGLVADVREVINQAKHLLLSKNEGNLIQDFIWDCQGLDGGNAKLPGAPTDKATAQQHGQEAKEGLKTLASLLLSNGQFRKLLQDATVLLRDIAGDAATHTAGKINPSDDQLNQIDQPAEDNTWHETPELSRANFKNQASSAYNKNKPFNRQQATDAANQAADQGMNDAQNTSGNNQDGAKAGVSSMASNLKGQAQANMSDEDQEKARNAKNQAVQRSKDYMGKKMPKERRDQTIWRMKKMIVEIQGHSDYQQAIETLLNLAETYGGHAKTTAKDSHGTVKGAHDDNSLQSAEANLKTLIERFANSTSSDDLFDSLNQIYRDADKDPELKGWFKSVDKFIRKCLKEQGFILQDSSNDEWNQIYDKGQFLLRDRYRDHTDRILDEVKFFGNQFDADPQNKAFANSMNRLFNDLGKDENGKATFKPHLIKDLTEVIIPAIFENTRYVPIPRIEASDPMIDAVVENLVIESDNLFPNVLEFGSDNYFRLGRKQIKNKRDNKIMIAGSGVQMDLKDVSYYIKKKQGFPSITDKGVMDIFLGGEGFSFKIAGRNAQQSDRTHFVVIDNVDVVIKNLQIKVKQSNHKLLFALAKPLLLKVMKPVIQKVLEKQIKDAFVKGDAYAYSIHQDAQKAINSAKNDPENAPGVYQQYLSAYQRKVTANKEKAKEKASQTEVNVAMTQQDSIFKNIALPGGISTKATEYKKLAEKGDRWESPVFGIGSAKESSNIPKLSEVTRKSHQTAQGGVRGGNHPGSSDESAMNQSAFGTNSGSMPGNTSSGTSTGFGNQVDQAFDSRGGVGSDVVNGGVPQSTGGQHGLYHDATTTS